MKGLDIVDLGLWFIFTRNGLLTKARIKWRAPISLRIWSTWWTETNPQCDRIRARRCCSWPTEWTRQQCSMPMYVRCLALHWRSKNPSLGPSSSPCSVVTSSFQHTTLCWLWMYDFGNYYEREFIQEEWKFGRYPRSSELLPLFFNRTLPSGDQSGLLISNITEGTIDEKS